MRNAWLLVWGILCLASTALARDKSDVVVMKNGDRLTCEIKGLDQGVLFIGLDYVQGTVQVDWSKIRRVESKQLFLVTTQDGRNYSGAISIDPDTDRVVRIESAEVAEAATTVRQQEVVRINQTSENVWQRFNGAINFGSTYSKANQNRQYSLGADAQYLRQRWSSGANYVSTLTGSTGAATSTRNNLIAYYRHLMRWNNWTYMGIGTLLQSTEQKIQLQSAVGAGIGRYLTNTNRSTVNVFGGMAYQNTRYTGNGIGPASQNTAAAMTGVEAGVFKFDKTRLAVSAMAFPALNQPGRVYSSINTSYYLKFWKDITWNISFYGSWDNQPPAHLSGSDYGTSTGIGWTFGNHNSFSQ